jgi:hypothetical protein
MTRRKAVAVALILIASLFVAGCASQKPQQTTPTAIPTNTAQNGSVTRATPARVPQTISEAAHAPDHQFFGFNVTVENIDAPATRISPENFQIKDSKGAVDGVAVARFRLPAYVCSRLALCSPAIQ